MTIGVCVQNMLLAAPLLGPGAVWQGKILNSTSKVNALLTRPDTQELMAVVALGHPAQSPRSSRRAAASSILKKM